MFKVLLLGAPDHLSPPSSSSQHRRVAVGRFGAGRGKAASSLLTEGLKASPSYRPGRAAVGRTVLSCGAELSPGASASPGTSSPHAVSRPRAEPAALQLVWFCPVTSLFIVLKRLNWSGKKKKKKDGFFFLPLSNESLGTFSLLTSESYPIAFAVRPDLQRTPWGKAKILVKPLKRKSTLRDDFLLLLCPDFTF